MTLSGHCLGYLREQSFWQSHSLPISTSILWGTKELVWLLNEKIAAFLSLFTWSWVWSMSLFFLLFYFVYFIFLFDYFDFCVCFKNKTISIYRFSPSSSPQLFQNFREFGAEKYFTDHRAANTNLLFLSIKGNFPGLFFLVFSKQVAAKRNYPETTW